MRGHLEDADALVEHQIKKLFRAFKKSGTATIELVQRPHMPGVELRYELAVAVVPGWMTTSFSEPGDKAQYDANIAATRPLLESWVADTVLMAGSVAVVQRCDLIFEKPKRGRPPEFLLCIAVRRHNAARVGFTRTTRAVDAGGSGCPGPDHVQSAVSDEP